MKIDIQKIDRVPFSILAKPKTDCPFYVGFGGGFNSELGWKRHERYCIARKVVALFYVLNQQYILTGCCCQFGTRLPRLEPQRLFDLAARKKQLAENRIAANRAGMRN